MSDRYSNMSDKAFIAKLKRDMDIEERHAKIMLIVFGILALAILIAAAFI